MNKLSLADEMTDTSKLAPSRVDERTNDKMNKRTQPHKNKRKNKR